MDHLVSILNSTMYNDIDLKFNFSSMILYLRMHYINAYTIYPCTISRRCTIVLCIYYFVYDRFCTWHKTNDLPSLMFSVAATVDPFVLSVRR